MTDPLTEQAKTVVDVAAGVLTVAALMEHAPQIAAVFTTVYVVLRIWETKTIRRLFRAMCARCAAWWEQGD